MDQRVAFIADWLRDEWTMRELAERYGISRKTSYKWVDRYTADPEHGLAERSRAPKVHGRAMADEVRDAVIALRRSHPHWGPKKLRAVLEARAPERVWPAASSMGDLLRRRGLSQPRRRPSQPHHRPSHPRRRPSHLRRHRQRRPCPARPKRPAAVRTRGGVWPSGPVCGPNARGSLASGSRGWSARGCSACGPASCTCSGLYSGSGGVRCSSGRS